METKAEFDLRMQEQEALWNLFEELYEDSKSIEIDLAKELAATEKMHIEHALAKANGNQTKAAKLLTLGRTCLIAKIKKFKL